MGYRYQGPYSQDTPLTLVPDTLPFTVQVQTPKGKCSTHYDPVN